MPADFKVTRRFPNNYVQVDVDAKNMPLRYFKMPADQVDSFSADYKKYDKNMRTSSSIRLALMTIPAAFIGVMGARLAGAKQYLQVIGGIVLGVGASILSTYIGAKKMEKAENALLKAHNAEQVFYEGNRLIK